MTQAHIVYYDNVKPSLLLGRNYNCDTTASVQ